MLQSDWKNTEDGVGASGAPYREHNTSAGHQYGKKEYDNKKEIPLWKGEGDSNWRDVPVRQWRQLAVGGFFSGSPVARKLLEPCPPDWVATNGNQW